MTQHYQKWVTEVLEICSTCMRVTKHAVSDGRVGRCLEHEVKVNDRGETKRQEQRRLKQEREDNNPTLF